MGGDRIRTIGALLTRLIESAKDFARAEIALAKATALDWFGQAQIALILLVAALVLALSAVTILLAALGMALAAWLGVAGGLAIAALIGLATAGILIAIAVKRLQGIGR